MSFTARKYLSALVLLTLSLGVLFLLTACGGPSEPYCPEEDSCSVDYHNGAWPVTEDSTAPETATVPAPTPDPVPDNVRLYLATLSLDSATAWIDDQAAVDLGYAICNNSQLTALEAIDAVMQGGFDAYQAGYIYGAAVGALCPNTF